jgi:predicted secreted hydrolase
MEEYNTANIKKQVSLPKDIGPHPFTDMEWWYCYAILNGDSGHKYAVMSAFYQAGELPILKGHYLIFSLIDLTECDFQSFSLLDEKLAKNIMLFNIPIHLLRCPHDKSTFKLYKNLLKGKLPPPHQWLPHAFIEKDPIRLSYTSSSMIFNADKEGEFKVTVSDNGIEARLKFNSIKPVSLIGGDGKPDRLYYYSFPRNEVKGYIKKCESTECVTGEGWFDHQWGYLGDLLIKTGWIWLGLQLEDGRELLINEFWSIKTGETFSPMANIIEAGGSLKFTRNLTLEPSNYWQSPLTNAVYPLKWTITIPEFKMVLNISAVFHNQEMPVLAPLNAIWEGVCNVSGTETNSNFENIPIKGKGFLELVGYANYKC